MWVSTRVDRWVLHVLIQWHISKKSHTERSKLGFPNSAICSRKARAGVAACLIFEIPLFFNLTHLIWNYSFSIVERAIATWNLREKKWALHSRPWCLLWQAPSHLQIRAPTGNHLQIRAPTGKGILLVFVFCAATPCPPGRTPPHFIYGANRDKYQYNSCNYSLLDGHVEYTCRTTSIKCGVSLPTSGRA